MADEVKLISIERLSDYNNNLMHDANILKRSTLYSVDNIVNKGLVYLKCTQSGTTSSTTLSFTGVQVGDILTDGTARWEVLSINGIPEGGGGTGAGLEDWESNHDYAVGDIYVYEGQIYKTLVKFASGATEDERIEINDIVPSVWEENTSYTAGDIIEHTDVTTLKKVYYDVTANFTSEATFEVTAEMDELQITEEYVPNPLTQAQVQNLINNFTPSGGGGGGSGTGLEDWQQNTPYAVNDLIVYNGTIYKVNTAFISGSTFDDTNLDEYVAKEMVGATSILGGARGLVPQPQAGDEEKFLRGDRTWSTVPGGGVKLADVSDVEAEAGVRQVVLKWTDPQDVIIQGALLAQWEGTKVVRKEGAVPTNKDDGTLVIDSRARNQYETIGYVDTNVVNGTIYYYRWFPYTDMKSYTNGTYQQATPNLLNPNLSIDRNLISIHSGATGQITVTSDSQGIITASSSDASIATAVYINGVVIITYVGLGTTTVVVSQNADGDYASDSRTITVNCVQALRYGYKIDKNESDPYARVTYLYDAVNMNPAYMDFNNGVFNYGSWQNVWFISDNKPCMLKSDGTVDYYLDPNDYDYKEDGITLSDVSNINYDGNAMAQFPLCWVYRYEDNDYCYEIVSNVQYDSNYKAYAHTRADGSIADYFYWGLFGGSDISSKIRSLAGQPLSSGLTIQQAYTASGANGNGWFIHTWSQRTLLNTLLVLIGKSTNTQEIFGVGNAHNNNITLTTGTLKTLGQFFGYSDNTHQVKAFHIEKLWGDQWDRTAGMLSRGNRIYVKMTPENGGYLIDSIDGYIDTNIDMQTGRVTYITTMNCNEYGMIPISGAGSGSTYYSDIYLIDPNWLSSSCYLMCGDSSINDDPIQGAGCFAIALHLSPTYTGWDIGYCLSCEQPN